MGRSDSPFAPRVPVVGAEGGKTLFLMFPFPSALEGKESKAERAEDLP